ncbi:hypothetical protein IC582_000311 [Cucumis melo]|uniref:Glycosyltransferase n=1 Tax=Cucumis melo TaxID=3656 RepID=A0A1S3C0N5_CUCME|nr:mogroside IE synthase-like [Cucumis melo]
MEKVREEGKVVHILVIPFPDEQGHINPILQFSKRLAFKGLKVTLLNLLHENNTLTTYDPSRCSSSNSIINVLERPRAPYNSTEPESIESYMHRLKTSICFHLTKLVTQYRNSNSPFTFVVYDSLMPWVLDLARAFGLRGAPFFTQSCAVIAIFYHIIHGSCKNIPPVAPAETRCELSLTLPGLPLDLHASDLPSLLLPNNNNPQQNNPFFRKLMIDQLHDLPDLMFVNSFHALEPQVIEFIQSQMPLKTVGPTVPSILINKELMDDDHDYGMNLINSTDQDDNNKIMGWLNSKARHSVIYVSLGTRVSNLGEEQMEELAWGLKATNKPFLWVIKEPQFPNSFFQREVKEMHGMVVKWCPQVQVLAHESVGCFMTHCGWNSVLEAITCGVPMVAMPQWGDQMTNAKFVEDVWNVGVRVSTSQENGMIVRREEIELCVRTVMEGEKSRKLRQNGRRWMKLAKEAVMINGNGTSDKNIDDFVKQLRNP